MRVIKGQGFGTFLTRIRSAQIFRTLASFTDPISIDQQTLSVPGLKWGAIVLRAFRNLKRLDNCLKHDFMQWLASTLRSIGAVAKSKCVLLWYASWGVHTLPLKRHKGNRIPPFRTNYWKSAHVFEQGEILDCEVHSETWKVCFPKWIKFELGRDFSTSFTEIMPLQHVGTLITFVLYLPLFVYSYLKHVPNRVISALTQCKWENRNAQKGGQNVLGI